MTAPMTPSAEEPDSTLMSGFFQKTWLWAFVAAALAFTATMFVSKGQGATSLLYTAMTFASFAAIVGVGQMLVITLGPGNIDLSIPASMTLSATLALKVMNTQSSMLLVGLAVALLVGIACGVFNFALILLLRIPPIIATLSSSFIFQSLAIWSNRGLRIKPPELMNQFVTGSILGIPNVACVGLIIAALVWLLLERSIAGRWISAIGQNMRAAKLSGVPVNSVRFAVYVSCSLLAAVSGFLLANFSGGAALNMGAEYMLMSIAVVVIGGSSIAGGNSNVPGIWGASLFMFLVVSMLNSYGLGAGVRMMMTGIIIVLVVGFASKAIERR